MLGLLCEYLVKSSVILSLSIVMVSFLRKKSAGLRHLVLSVFLIGLLFLPILSSVTAGWETKFLPSWHAGSAVNLKADKFTRHLDSSSKMLGSRSAAYDIAVPIEEVMENSRSVQSLSFSRVEPVLELAALLLWLAGLMFLSTRIALGFYGTKRLKLEGKEMRDSLWRRLLCRFLEAISLKRKIRLMSHDKTMVPLTWGAIKPVVMMPSESVNWSENQRSSALYHELSHVKRGDYLVMILARISRAVYWFNPLSWIVLGMIKREQEKACDELVLKAGIKPSTYAENLLFIRNSISGHWNPPAPVLGAVNKSHLNDRLTTILKQRFNLKEVQMKTKVLLSVLAILSISFIGLARPGNSPRSHAEAGSSVMAAVTAPVDSFESPADVQDQTKKEQKKEVKKEAKKEEGDKDKDKDKEKAKLVWTAKEGEKGTYEIIIDKDDPKKIIYVTPHVGLEKDSEAAWTIKADALELSDDAKKIKLGEGTFIYINEGDKDSTKVIKLESPHIQVKKVGKDKEHVEVDVEASPRVEVHPHVHVVIDKDEYQKLIKKIKEKLAELKVKDLEADVKEAEIKSIEEALEELQKTLEGKYEKVGNIALSVNTKDVHVDHDKISHAVAITDDKNTSFLIYQADLDTDKVEAFKKALKSLEDKLPEGYSVESSIDEDEGKLFLKITKEKDADVDKGTIKKLIEEFQEELAKIK
jgi:beta-lactamase regulating signal transducer with metallopeptidase domain/phage pi2 protein 07